MIWVYLEVVCLVVVRVVLCEIEVYIVVFMEVLFCRLRLVVV